jgi:hypothetical protein
MLILRVEQSIDVNSWMGVDSYKTLVLAVFSGYNIVE